MYHEIKNEQFFVCTCGSDAISVQAIDADESTREVALAIWRWAPHFGLRARLRYIWRIIRYGYPYLDDVVLSTDDALDLARAIWEAASGAEREE